MSGLDQMVLPFEARVDTSPAEYLAAPANRDALRWVESWPDWPGPGLVVVGPAAAGKTHLARVWAARAGAGWVFGPDLSDANAAALAVEHRACVVDQGDAAAHEPLLHLYNLMVERRGHMLITARSAPAEWPVALADLRSRVRSLPTALIRDPDDALIHALLIKRLAERGLPTSTETVDYLAVRIERSYETVNRVVEALYASAMALKQPLTVPLARTVLASL